MFGVGAIEAFLWGVFGGAGLELLQWYRIRNQISQRAQAAKLPYWIVTTLMVLFGGGLACAHVFSDASLTPILAVNVGLTAPLALTALSRNIPEIGLNAS